jgi:SAM-dependent methyltransferase
MLARQPDFAEAVDATCLDLDPAALDCVRLHIGCRLDGQAHFVCENALRYARSPHRPDQPFDVIYAAGLFDYLNAGLAARLIEDCHGLLVPGGVLIVGNFSLETHPSDRVLIDWLLDWHLLYRNEADYRAIFAQTSFDPTDLHFEYEPLRANLFAVALRK